MHIRDLIYGLLDCSMALLFVLPFFGQKVNGAIQEVSLLALTEIQVYLKILYLVTIVGMTAFGILTLALLSCNGVRWVKYKSKVSLSVNAIGVFLFIISQQPYAAVYVFAFLIIKALMLIKR